MTIMTREQGGRQAGMALEQKLRAYILKFKSENESGRGMGFLRLQKVQKESTVWVQLFFITIIIINTIIIAIITINQSIIKWHG